MPDATVLTFDEVMQRLDDEICATLEEARKAALARRHILVCRGEDVSDLDGMIARTGERIAAIQQEQRHGQ